MQMKLDMLGVFFKETGICIGDFADACDISDISDSDIEIEIEAMPEESTIDDILGIPNMLLVGPTSPRRGTRDRRRKKVRYEELPPSTELTRQLREKARAA